MTPTIDNKINSISKIEFAITLKLTESEARALKEMAGYSVESFLEFFYENLGTHYLKPHEKGVRSLFETIRAELPKHLSRVDKARKAFES